MKLNFGNDINKNGMQIGRERNQMKRKEKYKTELLPNKRTMTP